MTAGGDRTDTEMTLERLAVILEAYGAEPRRWPAGERAAALALLARSAEARSRHAAAAALDTVLDLAAEPEVTPALEQRVRSGIPHRARVIGRMRARRLALLGAGLAAAATLAVWLARAQWLRMPVLEETVLAQLDTLEVPSDAMFEEASGSDEPSSAW